MPSELLQLGGYLHGPAIADDGRLQVTYGLRAGSGERGTRRYPDSVPGGHLAVTN
jgi:hypothetical protein